MQNSHFMVEFNGEILAKSKENRMIAHMGTEIIEKKNQPALFYNESELV